MLFAWIWFVTSVWMIMTFQASLAVPQGLRDDLGRLSTSWAAPNLCPDCGESMIFFSKEHMPCAWMKKPKNSLRIFHVCVGMCVCVCVCVFSFQEICIYIYIIYTEYYICIQYRLAYCILFIISYGTCFSVADHPRCLRFWSSRHSLAMGGKRRFQATFSIILLGDFVRIIFDWASLRWPAPHCSVQWWRVLVRTFEIFPLPILVPLKFWSLFQIWGHDAELPLPGFVLVDSSSFFCLVAIEDQPCQQWRAQHLTLVYLKLLKYEVEFDLKVAD